MKTLLVSALWIWLTASQLSCQNGGVPIMVRNKSAPYERTMMCLCPFIYYGDDCAMIRGIYCYLDNEKVLSFNSVQASLQFEIECFLKQYEGTGGSKKKINNYRKLPISDFQIEFELNQNNYYIDEGMQIVWANSSSIFNATGELIRKINDSRSDEQILNSTSHYRFNSSQTFFGLPTPNVNISYNLSSVSFTKQHIDLGHPTIEYTGNSSRRIGALSAKIAKDMYEYGTIKLELQIIIHYGDETPIYHRVGMKSAKWRIFDPNFPRGAIISTSSNKIPASLSVLLAFLGMLTLIVGGKLLVKYYKRYKSHKLLTEVQEQQYEERQVQ